MKSEDLTLHSLKAISPIDGRHRLMTEPLADWFSEFALFKYRIYIEVEYLIALSELEEFKAVREFTAEEKEFLRNIVNNFTLENAQTIQNIDRFGYKDKKPTNHDVKSAEYFLKEKIAESSLRDVVEMVHFGLTSEDINNNAQNVMIKGVLEFYYVPALVRLLDKLKEYAEEEKRTVMLGRTHGQPATPTTFGKEMANYLERLRKELLFLQEIKLPGKLNGAVGNHNAQHFAAPEIDWIKFAQQFIEGLGFEANLFTTQIEPHDGLTKLFCSLISLNNILRDLSVDLWMYISANYLVQEKIAHEVGSSTMPHKINPWRLEVAEGSTVEANAKLNGFVWKLQASRLQRDLSDHEAQRAMGVGLAHSYLAVLHVIEELERLKVNRESIYHDLKDFGSILTEAIQTLLRKEGYEEPYELMKDFSRGTHCTVEELHNFVNSMKIKEETKTKIKELKPDNYFGLAEELANIAVKKWNEFKENYEEPIPPIKEVILDCSVLTAELDQELNEVGAKLKKKGICITGVNVLKDNVESKKKLFTKLILEEDLGSNKAGNSKAALFIGKVGKLFNAVKEKGMLCINIEDDSGEKSEYNILTLAEIVSVINSLQEAAKRKLKGN